MLEAQAQRIENELVEGERLEGPFAFNPRTPPAAVDLVHVIYPEDFYATPDLILGWAHDALVNSLVDDYVKANGPFGDDADGDLHYETFCKAIPRPTDLQEAMALLRDRKSVV